MEFDRFAADYQCEVERAAGVSVEQLAAEKARLLLAVLSAELGDPNGLRVLDVGCGIGLVARELARGVGELCGADVSLRSLEFARSRAPSAHFACYDGAKLPFGDASFDAVVAICVLHHVPPNARAAFIAELLRTLRYNGLVVIIEHNLANPVTRYIVSRCAFDADAVLLSCRETVDLLATGGAGGARWRYIGFLPFRHPLVERAERAIGWLPVGAQYCVWSRKRSVNQPMPKAGTPARQSDGCSSRSLVMTDAALGDASPLPLMRPEQGGRWLNALLLTVVLFLALVAIGSNLLIDPDSQWHVAVGSKIWSSGHLPQVDELSHTFAGSPWIATQWLSELFFFGAFSLAGWSGVVVLTALTVALAFGILLYWLEGRLKWVTALSIALAVVPIASSHFLARPEIFALLLLILFLGATVDAVEHQTRPPLWLVPLMALWANLHGSFPLAIVIFGFLAAEALLSADTTARPRIVWQWGTLFALLIAATCVTPYGFRPLLITFFVLSDGEAAKHLNEWQPIYIEPAWWVAVTLLALTACLAFTLLDWRRSLFRTVLVLALAYLMVRHVRFANIFAIVSAFAVAYPIRRVIPSLNPYATRIPLPRSILLGLAPLIVVAGLVLVGLSRPEPPREVAPRDALIAARRLGLTGLVFNDFNFNGFLLASGVKTFIDGRTDQLFVHGFMDKLTHALIDEDPGPLLAMLSGYNVSWALVEKGRRADVKLSRSNGWEEVYRDDIAVVYRQTRFDRTGTRSADP